MTRCFLLLVDGLHREFAEAELASGSLPHLAALTARGGRTCGITAFPSTTSVAYLPFLTGCTPGRCNIPSIRWLDRAQYAGAWWRDRATVRSYCGYQAGLLDSDIAAEVATIFELVPESIGLFTPVARGLTPKRDPTRLSRKLWGAVAHYAQWHQPSDDSVAHHLLAAAEGPARFVFAQFPAVDGYAHQQGPTGDGVKRALRRVDATVGRLTQVLQARGELEHSLILVVSDHGAAPVHTHLDLADWFRARGVRTLAHPVLWTRAPEAAVMVAGNSSAMVYAQPGRPRDRRWPLAKLRQPETFGLAAGRDIVSELLAEAAVGLVAAEESAGVVRVASQSGDAELRRMGECIDYRPVSGDPLAIGGARRAHEREWLEATWNQPHPDAAYQLLDQFRSPRTGDLVVSAQPGFDFRARFEVPEHKAGHGSLTRDHMQTPVWSSAPLPAGPLRSVDLFPAMLHWLGVARPGGLDGASTWRPAPGAVVAAASLGVGSTVAAGEVVAEAVSGVDAVGAP